MPAGYEHVSLFDIPALDEGEDEGAWRPVRHHLGISAFGVNAYSASASGAAVVGRHDEADTAHEELYLVLAGRATFRLDGELVDAPAGTLIRVAPGVTREAMAAVPDTTVIGFGAPLGRAFAPSEWESRALSGHGLPAAS
jgi:hypothetical protein